MIRPLSEQVNSTYVYQLLIPSSITLPPHSLKSVRFFETNMTVESYGYYSSIFSPVNSTGKLFNAYDLTSFDKFIPHGRFLLHAQGKFVGQMNFPDLSKNRTLTLVFSYNPGVSYRRQVQILEGDENTDSIIYNVEYIFENSISPHDVSSYFLESFSSFKYFQIKNLSTSKDLKHVPDLVLSAIDLPVYILIPRLGSQKRISYYLIIYKFKPAVHM